MPAVSKVISAFDKEELINLCKLVKVNHEDLSVPELKRTLTSFFSKNPKQLSVIPGFYDLKLSTETEEPQGQQYNPGTSQNTDTSDLVVCQSKTTMTSPQKTNKSSIDDLLPIFQSLAQTIAQATSTRDTSNPHYFLQECNRRKLHFSGDREEDVNLFLQNFDKVADLFAISDDNKRKFLPELLRGNAAVWHRSNSTQWNTWSELVHALETVYCKFESDIQRKIDLLQRTQAHLETMDHFTASVKSLNTKLKKPLTDDELLELIKQNIHPDYVDFIYNKNPSTLQELEKLAREFEKRKNLKKAYRPPPGKLLTDEEFGDLSLHKKESTSGNFTPNKNFYKTKTAATQIECGTIPRIEEGQQIVFTTPVRTTSTSPVPASTQSTQTGSINKICCYNCKQLGHVFQNCRLPRRIFCYHCGKDDVFSPDCDCASYKSYTNVVNSRGTLN